MLARTLPTIVLLLVAATAGCLTPSDTTTDAPTTATPIGTIGNCPDGIERLDATVTNGSVPARDAGFAIEGNRTTLQRGDTLQVTLRNVADNPRGTGTGRMIVLQRNVDDEWTTVLGAREGRTGWNATLVMHEPGEGYTWNVTLDDDGLTEWGYELCSSLPPGDYRIVYHGLVKPGGFDDRIPDPAVAVEFRIVA
ncbi:MAG: immunoglobulin-like domain-containing protein [Halorhabdus sp.]